MNKLKFQNGNMKLSKDISFLNLPAGYSCPMAEKCLSKFDLNTNKIVDGPKVEFRCFGAMEERYPAVRNIRWSNFDLLKKARTLKNMVELITESLPDTPLIRPHASAGDFYNETYFKAWLNVALNNSTQTFYTYSKMIPYLIKYRSEMPSNYNIVSSFGGKHDHLIEKHDLQYAKVVNTPDEAAALGLEIDFDDSHAYAGKKSFALLIHGSQPAGTVQAKAAHANKKIKNEWKAKVKPKRTTTILVS